MGYISANSLVSICTPCYNHEKYLDDYFQGIMHQDYECLELVIIDDASSDASVSIIEKYIPILEEKGISVLFSRHENNKGISYTFNELIKRSSGAYIKPIASDDILVPDCISNMVSYMIDHPDTLVLIGNTCLVDNSYHYGNKYDPKPLMDINWIRNLTSIHEKLFESCFINSPGEFFDKRIFEKYGYFDENLLYEDWDFFLRVSKYETIHFLDDIFVLYRKSETSISNYAVSENREEAKIRFAKMYAGTRDLFRKHRGEIPDDRWKECFFKRYNIYLNDADSLGCYESIKEIFRDMKEDGVKGFSFRQKMAYIMKHKMPAAFRLIKRII